MLRWHNRPGAAGTATMRRVKLLAILCVLVSCNTNKVNTSFSSDQVQSEQATESFTPEKKTHDKLDILLVIDDSGSMSQEHETLSTRLNDLLSAVNDTDWQIAITTTNPLSCLLTVIDKNTADYERIFTETINVENLLASHKDLRLYDRQDAEQAVYGAIRGLRGDCIASRSYSNELSDVNPMEYRKLAAESRNGFNSVCHPKKTWVRDGSMLAVLLITDEDHQCNHHHGCHITDFYFYLKSIRTPHATGRVYGLLNERESQAFLNWKDADGESLFDYHDSVHSPDYTKILTEISQNISAALKNNFTLEHEHDGGSAEVTITTADGATQTLSAEQYSVDGNTLSITSTMPANTSKIEITYTH